MMKLNQQGVVQLLLILILLAGLGVGLYLVGQKTNLLPKASVGNIDSVDSITRLNEIESKSEKVEDSQIRADRTATIPVLVFEDFNRNGIKDEGEVGIPNILVTGKAFYSYANLENPTAKEYPLPYTTVVGNTDISGIYQFSVPGSGIYIDKSSSENIKVQLEYISAAVATYNDSTQRYIDPVGWTRPSQGFPPSITFRDNGVSFELNPAGDTVLETIRFPLIGAQKITGQIFYDNNRNGVRDGDELQSDRVVGGANILLDATKADNATSKFYYGVSNPDGSYEINNLPPLSQYRIKVSPACPFVSTSPPQSGLTLGSAGNVVYNFGVVFDENDPCVTN